MKLKRLAISNCSRIKDLDIEVRDNLVLIGPNGSGKTTVLLCLDMLLGMDTQRLYGTISKDFVRDIEKPFSVEGVFGSLTDDELAAFPDEVDTQNDSDLFVRLEARVVDGEISISRYYPKSGTSKSPSRIQCDAFGWTLLQAQENLREARQGRNSIVDEVMSEIGLGTDENSVGKIVQRAEELLAESSVLEAMRENLANHLPSNGFGKDDLELFPGAEIDGDLISDMRHMADEDERMRLIYEHSDGARVLFAMAIYDYLQQGANVLAIDEPEAHLHPSSQRSLARLLKLGSSQKVLVTHSPTIAGSFDPNEIVVIRADGFAAQPERGFLSGDVGMVARWWVGRQLEPLTAGVVVAVEGASDRIIVSKVAEALDFDLDRNDVVVVETEGCGNMKAVESIFGDGGFGIPLFELVDDDNREDIAKRIGANPDDPADLAKHHVFVSVKDLEDEYVRAIGADKLWAAFSEAGVFSKKVLNLCNVGPDGSPTEENLAEFARNRKIPSALIAADLIDATNASKVGSVMRLLKAASS